MKYQQFLTPTISCQGSVVDLDLEALTKRGVKGLILDFDDTLLPLGALIVDPAVVQWVEQSKGLFKVWIVSNNPNRKFLEAMGQVLGLQTITSANKPSRRALLRVLTEMDLPPQQVAIIGDRLFTDVLVGNRLGMVTVLVKPPGNSTVFWQGGFLRRIERFLVRPLS
ncbi:YqeG family HAD IIIA-type phosphatase [Candidatus Cyanaurora vandensis]|uniref:YqeG family HAD IIIA-type phosphatase n=1 Tax=Candidatus Cyanaurora vandensis TaxID=2714958 RepID=UPI00257E8731|nr:YqeG family HAD IIIA-type phosphatase [Candidatus Cyanaurora vandensis]